jgi:hypothetical protein
MEATPRQVPGREVTPVQVQMVAMEAQVEPVAMGKAAVCFRAEAMLSSPSQPSAPISLRGVLAAAVTLEARAATEEVARPAKPDIPVAAKAVMEASAGMAEEEDLEVLAAADLEVASMLPEQPFFSRRTL